MEYGLESCPQLLLQLWLLRPFLPAIILWDSTELIRRCASGLLNYVTFSIHPACYIEKALGKILLSTVLLSFGVARMHCSKPGLGLTDQPHKLLPILVSVLAQITARIYAIWRLIVHPSLMGDGQIFIFFGVHIILVFLVKILFERKFNVGKIKACQQECCSSGRTLRKFVRGTVFSFLVSSMSSLIVTIPLQEDMQSCWKPHFSLVTHTFFFLLVLVENVVLVCLPPPPPDCFPLDSQLHTVMMVIFLGCVGVVGQLVHYKWAHPWAPLNGPQEWCTPAMSFQTVCCWKKHVQLVKCGACPCECEDIR